MGVLTVNVPVALKVLVDRIVQLLKGNARFVVVRR